jgi:hypothetical protein
MESVRRMRIFSQMSDAEVIDLLERARSFSPDVAGVVEKGGEE